MKEYATYKVSFRWYDTDTFCTNIAKGYLEDIEKHYTAKGHEIIDIHRATVSEVCNAEERGMPIIKI